MVKTVFGHLQALCAFIFDALFPPSEEATVVSGLTNDDMALLYRPRVRTNVLMLSDFNDKRVRALVHEAKFHSNKKAIGFLGLLLKHYFENERPNESTVVIPVPLHPARYRARGYNQVEAVINEAAAHTSMYIQRERKVLKRVRNTKPQTGLKKEARAKNVAGAFRAANRDVVESKTVLLIDDVITTGSTLLEAKKELEKSSARTVLMVALSG